MKNIQYYFDQFWTTKGFELSKLPAFVNSDAAVVLERFNKYSTQDIIIADEEKRFRTSMQKGIAPSQFLETMDRQAGYYPFWETLYKLIAYLDSRGYRSPNWTENIASITTAGVYQHYWIYNLLAYKAQNNNLDAINSLHVKRAMQYLEQPEIYSTVLSEQHRKLICQHLLNIDGFNINDFHFDNEVRNFFEKDIKIHFIEEANRMWAYSSFLYDYKELWLKLDSLNFGIKQLKIENFCGIKSTSIDNLTLKNRWIFLTGENGYGKTSVLQAIALGLLGIQDFAYLLKGNPNCNVSITIQKGKPEKNSIFKKKDNTSTLKKPLLTNKVLAYGSSRLTLADTDSYKTKNEESPIRSLFQNNTAFRNIEAAFADWHIKRNENDMLRAKYEQLQYVFSELFPKLQIVPNEQTNEITYIEKDIEDIIYQSEDNKPSSIKFDQLASGYKTIIAIVGDMILNLYDAQPSIINISDLSGIVLIDEIELHLHPKWQRDLPTILSKIFPLVQFIVSTHSPIPLLGSPKDSDSVFLKVNRTQETGIVLERWEQLEHEIKNLLPNTILSSPIFGLTNFFPISNDDIGAIRTEDSYQEKEFNDQVDAKLRGYLESEENRKKLEDLFKS